MSSLWAWIQAILGSFGIDGSTFGVIVGVGYLYHAIHLSAHHGKSVGAALFWGLGWAGGLQSALARLLLGMAWTDEALAKASPLFNQQIQTEIAGYRAEIAELRGIVQQLQAQVPVQQIREHDTEIRQKSEG
jgi:hypothetical protein